jgi:hypothetical protein
VIRSLLVLGCCHISNCFEKLRALLTFEDPEITALYR